MDSVCWNDSCGVGWNVDTSMVIPDACKRGSSGQSVSSHQQDDRRGDRVCRYLDDSYSGDLSRCWGCDWACRNRVFLMQRDIGSIFVPETLQKKYGSSFYSVSGGGLCGGDGSVSARLNGSAAIEMLYVFSAFFLCFLLAVYSLFYYHDKNILAGAAYEAAVIQSQKLREPQNQETEDVGESFARAASRRMILFGRADMKVEKSEKEIVVRASASGRRMKISVVQRAAVTKPERFIRDLRKVKGNED